MSEACCLTQTTIPPISPECDYIPPAIKKLWVRKTKKGQVQVKINGKGKWINAQFEEETGKLSFVA